MIDAQVRQGDMEPIDPQQPYNVFLKEYQFTGVQSGGNVPTVFFGLIDAYGQVVSTDRGSRINFELLVDSQTFSPDFTTEIVGVTEFFSAFGTYNMSGMMLLS